MAVNQGGSLGAFQRTGEVRPLPHELEPHLPAAKVSFNEVIREGVEALLDLVGGQHQGPVYSGQQIFVLLL